MSQKTFRFNLISAILWMSGVTLCMAAPVLAIAHGYASSDAGLKPGMVVSLSESNQDGSSVERANQNGTTRVVGIATTVGDGKVIVASGNDQVYVENEGEIDAYVSDINGKVRKGDLLAVSAFRGILAKADANSKQVMAIAVQDFPANSGTQYAIDGSAKTAGVATLRVNLDRKGIDESIGATSPSQLEKLGEKLTGHAVQEIRMLVAVVIFFVVMIVEGAILYGSISSSITALGRNPMARRFITRELMRVVVVTLLVLLLGLGSIYTILWI